jgi:hypothetical protein
MSSSNFGIRDKHAIAGAHVNVIPVMFVGHRGKYDPEILQVFGMSLLKNERLPEGRDHGFAPSNSNKSR